mgnify:CR=1 FL=1
MSDSSHGWGYLGGMVESTNGLPGSVQVRVDNSRLGGDSGFVYDTATGIVTITGGLIVAGTPMGQGNMNTIPENATQTYQANSMNVIYTEDTDTVTIEDGATMDIGLDATVKMKRYSEV